MKIGTKGGPNLANLPIIEPKPKSIKVRVSPQMLPMFATICPVEIAGSFDTRDGTVGLVLRGASLPDGEYGTIFCERDGASSTISIKALDA